MLSDLGILPCNTVEGIDFSNFSKDNAVKDNLISRTGKDILGKISLKYKPARHCQKA